MTKVEQLMVELRGLERELNKWTRARDEAYRAGSQAYDRREYGMYEIDRLKKEIDKEKKKEIDK